MLPSTPLALAVADAPGGPGLWQVFLSSGLVGKAVLALLAVLSIASWAVIVGKGLQFYRAGRQGRRFLGLFRRSRRFSEVHSSSDALAASPLVGLFEAGYIELDSQVKARRREGEGENEDRFRIKSLESVERSLRRAVGAEQLSLARGNGILATTAAASPFIGLFGTVWGIMLAFHDIGLTGSTSLVAVAPGIAEALINTAAGLAAAIPALVAYNYSVHRIRAFRAEMEDFALEFMNLAERNFT